MIDYDCEYEEWLSVCCTASPMFELHHYDLEETTGVCSQCREHTTFINYEEEE